MKIRFWDPGLAYNKIKPEVDKAMQDVLNRGDLILREDVEKFEETLADYVGAKYAVAVNSGTDAVFLSLKALGIGEGDEVITVSHTFLATIESIVHTGAKPILVDIGNDYLMDMDQVADAITERTKAIIPVHLSGDVCDIDKLQKILSNYDTPPIIIEDSAQALGAVKPVGVTQCFSFYPAKTLGCFGDGGAITTNDKEIADEIRKLRNHYCIGKGQRTEKAKFGYNSRMDNIQAAVLNVKIKYLDDYISRRKEIAEMYDEGLKDCNIILPKIRDVYQDYIIRSMDKLNEYLNENGVETLGAGLVPNHKYKGLDLDFELLNTEQYTKEFIRLPCNPDLENKEVEYIISTIKKFYEK